ncbi:acyltransferase [Mesorhizobium sp. B2-3-10]|uniref:acyltransferase family protein n=1 Tax=Mesorhizobium sp. B2-3-10 TaxID=2589954 RepID=UPI0011287A40|nr:acyltransferase [Mesorhizobium sp. B2-3-10]TPL97305.1 acyltransferase [Mesorhizobium sp. B2-3-10]
MNGAMSERNHIAALDGLRGFAALTVLVSHLSNQTRIFDAVLGEGAGQLGVMLFFALSGFLMVRLYTVEAPTASTVLSFYQRRTARVFPLYLLLVGLSFVLTMGLQALLLYKIDLSNLAEHLLFWHGESFLWTVPVEVQFYALFPLFWLVVARYGRGWIWLAMVVLAALSLAGMTSERWLPHHLQYFMLGIVIAGSARQLPGWSVYVCLAAYVLAFPRIVGLAGFYVGDVWTSPIHMAIIGALLFTAANVKGSFLESAPMKYLGTVSYSLYLLHAPIIAAFAQTSLASSNWTFVPAVMIASVGAATLSYFFVEAPARRALNGARFVGLSKRISLPDRRQSRPASPAP